MICFCCLKIFVVELLVYISVTVHLLWRWGISLNLLHMPSCEADMKPDHYAEQRGSEKPSNLPEVTEVWFWGRSELSFRNQSVKFFIWQLFFLLFFFLTTFLIELWLVYNAMLVSGVQQSDSVICISIYLSIYLFFFRFFSIIGYYKILNIVPCAIQ